jgi:hypothetical protein
MLNSHRKLILENLKILSLSLNNNWVDVFSLIKKRNPLLSLGTYSGSDNLSKLKGSLFYESESLKSRIKELENIVTNSSDSTDFSSEDLYFLSALSNHSSRLDMGQLSSWITFLNNKTAEKEDFFFICPEIDSIRSIKSSFYGLENNAYYGINSTDLGQKAKINYDMHQVIRNFLAYEKTPSGGLSIDFDEPLSCAFEDLIVIVKSKTH